MPIFTKNTEETQAAAGLKGKLLVASPALTEEFFSRTVVYICEHGEEGAMGLVINRPIENITGGDILKQLDKNDGKGLRFEQSVHAGGPLDEQRGFILHSSDYVSRHTVGITNGISITSSVDILRHIAKGKGPRNNLIVLGYAGWQANQLEKEIEEQSWFVAPADSELLFGGNSDVKWLRASHRVGIRPEFFITEPGRC